jgi:hypothetical protein
VTYDGSATLPVHAGTYNVVAAVNQAGYSGTASGMLTVNQAAQSISFGNLASVTVGAAPFALNGSASSGLPVAYMSDTPSVATVSGNTVTITGPGTAHITATQSGNADYLAATNVIQTLTVNTSTGVPTLPAWASVSLAVLLATLGGGWLVTRRHPIS